MNEMHFTLLPFQKSIFRLWIEQVSVRKRSTYSSYNLINLAISLLKLSSAKKAFTKIQLYLTKYVPYFCGK